MANQKMFSLMSAMGFDVRITSKDDLEWHLRETTNVEFTLTFVPFPFGQPFFYILLCNYLYHSYLCVLPNKV